MGHSISQITRYILLSKNEDSKGFGLDAWKSMDLVDSIYKIKLH